MTNAGLALEARVQRLFLAQGIFAERSLFPAAKVGRRLVATDIDVLVSEYSSGFNVTLRHAECKSGRRVSTLDRTLWLTGVRTMLGANSSHLVLNSFNEGAADFARSLGVDIITLQQLAIWEHDLKIPRDDWPNRSAFELLDPMIDGWFRRGKLDDATEKEKVVRETIQFIRVDSWRQFQYTLLNRSLRLLQLLSTLADGKDPFGEQDLSIRYAASATLVRLSQYLLAICHDVSRVPVSDLDRYLNDRLTFGDQDPQRARSNIRNTVKWVTQALNERGLGIPPEANPDRLFKPPPYSDGLIALVRTILSVPHEAKFLPISIDTELFGDDSVLPEFPRLRSASVAGIGLARLVKGFVIASLGVDARLIAPMRRELALYGASGDQGGESLDRAPSSQSMLQIHD